MYRRKTMKKKSLFLGPILAVLACGSLSGCAGNSNDIVVWVGSESVTYYRSLAKEFLKENKEFGYNITITGTDVGSAGGKMNDDNSACGDIVTIAHDNIGKLSQKAYIAPIVDQPQSHALYQQIMDDNPEAFIKAIDNIYGNDASKHYTFGVPYISQALFLYYDTRYVTDEQAETFEGLEQAAANYDATYHPADNTKSYTVTGTDGYNFSFALLARNVSGGTEPTLRLYEGGEKTDCYVQSNEQVAIMRHMQNSYNATNGGDFKNLAKWGVKIQQHTTLSVIGGAWHYNAFKAAVTDDQGNVHMGCKPIPTFTLTAADVEGIEAVNYPNDPSLPEDLRGKADPAPVAGTVYRGGSFVDCKCFVINMAKMTGVEKYYKMCEVLKYFSSKNAQNGSYLEAYNVPAYAGANEFVEESKDLVEETVYKIAKAQTGMSEYGIPQPFVNGTLNTYYYSKGAPDLYTLCMYNTTGTYGTVQDVRKTLFTVEYVWKNGNKANIDSPLFPTTFPHESTTKIK